MLTLENCGYTGVERTPNESRHRKLTLENYGYTGVERTPNKSRHRKLTLENKILLPLLQERELAAFDYEFDALRTSYPGSVRSTPWSAPAPLLCTNTKLTVMSVFEALT